MKPETKMERSPSPAGPSSPVATWEDVTPEIATQLLEGNTDNRRLDQRRVDAIAADIVAGAWQETGDTVKIAADGEIIDGQHRLWGIVEAGRGVRLLVVRGIAKEARVAVDRHRPRRDADDLEALGGVTDAARAVALVKNLDRLLDGPRVLSYRSVEALYQSRREHFEWAIEATRTAKWMSFTSAAAALALAHCVKPSRIATFASKVLKGANLDEGAPALALRNYLLDTRRVRGDARRTVSLKVLRAARAFLDGEQLQALRPADDATLEFFAEAWRKVAPEEEPATARAAAPPPPPAAAPRPELDYRKAF